MKKFLSLLLIVVIMLSLVGTAFAEGKMAKEPKLNKNGGHFTTTVKVEVKEVIIGIYRLNPAWKKPIKPIVPQPLPAPAPAPAPLPAPAPAPAPLPTPAATTTVIQTVENTANNTGTINNNQYINQIFNTTIVNNTTTINNITVNQLVTPKATIKIDNKVKPLHKKWNYTNKLHCPKNIKLVWNRKWNCWMMIKTIKTKKTMLSGYHFHVGAYAGWWVKFNTPLEENSKLKSDIIRKITPNKAYVYNTSKSHRYTRMSTLFSRYSWKYNHKLVWEKKTCLTEIASNTPSIDIDGTEIDTEIETNVEAPSVVTPVSTTTAVLASEAPAKEDNTIKATNDDKLPKTGESSPIAPITAGTLLVIGGAALLIRKKLCSNV